jgi:hypothetical protein
LKKAGPHPRDHVPLRKPAARSFCSRRSSLDSVQVTRRNPFPELNSLFGGLRWASSLLFSQPRLG